jgi:hypothetical protein
MKLKKSGQLTLAAYLCRFRPEPEAKFTVTSVVSHAQAYN